MQGAERVSSSQYIVKLHQSQAGYRDHKRGTEEWQKAVGACSNRSATTSPNAAQVEDMGGDAADEFRPCTPLQQMLPLG